MIAALQAEKCQDLARPLRVQRPSWFRPIRLRIAKVGRKLAFGKIHRKKIEREIEARWNWRLEDLLLAVAPRAMKAPIETKVRTSRHPDDHSCARRCVDVHVSRMRTARSVVNLIPAQCCADLLAGRSARVGEECQRNC